MRIPLDVKTVREGLVTPGRPWRDVEFHAVLGSTNDRAREIVTTFPRGTYAAGPGPVVGPLWRVVLTDHQTGGRGRLGRVWSVPDRASVAVSAVVPVARLEDAGWLPLLAGLALSRAIRTVTAGAGHPVEPHLKWPNDVLLADDADRKVSGILCELVTVPGAPGGHAVIVGTGVNIDQTREELPVDTATSLALAGASVRREDLVVAYLRELEPLVLALAEAGETGGPAGAEDGRAAYRLACSTIGADVRVHLPSEDVEGVATGVDDAGALLVETPTGVRAFAAGDVVHVRRRRSRVE
ncbi:biotin--acetyl-CoA-carboxylase ligase [Intrasporangium oryzae NRRL B-24470]|uniref:biotin--[biotin carboxyl-carrier protein] ligase n=1 Tax=Intrasporangium oryzae NRRL B-24470 TaxID=1386089 RepID=W9G4Q1_9MICO|nr:biotin--[acetyl-CoA-carboxylase] ligase [Intrasporangium oryzae]EWT01106.1 biotin--acetyl-CoA-carboxylase ligase [Intrasporangium oryzae NRRL B-24470]